MTGADAGRLERLERAIRGVAEAGRGVADAAERQGGPFTDPYYKVPAEDMDELKAALREWTAASDAALRAIAEEPTPPRVVELALGESVTVDASRGPVVVNLPPPGYRRARVVTLTVCDVCEDPVRCSATGTCPAHMPPEDAA